MGVAAALYQETEETKKFICYISACLMPHKRRYHSNKPGRFTVVWAIKHYRPHLEDEQVLGMLPLPTARIVPSGNDPQLLYVPSLEIQTERAQQRDPEIQQLWKL